MIRAWGWGGVAFVLVATIAPTARAARCKQGEAESEGVCCPRGAVFDKGLGDCATEVHTKEPSEKKTTIRVEHDFTVGGVTEPCGVRLLVDGRAPVGAAGDVFEVDADKPLARVDVQSPTTYDAHFYVPVGDARVVHLDGELTPTPALVVEIVTRQRSIQAHVAAKCDDALPQDCFLQGSERTCAFTTRCDSVRVYVNGDIGGYVSTERDVATRGSDTARVTFQFSDTKLSMWWLAMPGVTALASIGLLAASAAVSDEHASEGFLATGAIVGTLSVAAVPVLLGYMLSPHKPTPRAEPPAFISLRAGGAQLWW